MAILTKNGKTRTVKNLGWLLRNWREVESFKLAKHGKFPNDEGRMTAFLKCGGKYETGWASFDLMQEWIKRPVFFGLKAEIVISYRIAK